MGLPLSTGSRERCRKTMAKVKIFSQMSELIDANSFRRFVSALVADIVQKMNGTLSFVENIRATGGGDKDNPSRPLGVTFPSSSDVLAVKHNLGFVPNGFLVVKLNSPEVVYAPTASAYEWTSDTIYLQASGAVTASIYVI